MKWHSKTKIVQQRLRDFCKDRDASSREENVSVVSETFEFVSTIFETAKISLPFHLLRNVETSLEKRTRRPNVTI